MTVPALHARVLFAVASVFALTQARAEAQGPVLNPANGHYYEAIDVSGGVTWTAANAAANSMSFQGIQGHLATLTDSAENQWVSTQLTYLANDYWIGGIQDHNSPGYSEPGGGWSWVTGEAWSFTAWGGSEPNNAGPEDFLNYYQGTADWNDNYDSNNLAGFIVEYELPPVVPFCFGDGSAGACPCSNSGLAGNGCDNSAATGGALLVASGVASLSADTLQFACSGELPHSLSIVLQGTASVGPLNFGDGLRCTGGLLKRLYVRNAVNGAVTVPAPGDPSVSARAAALNDPITAGSTRNYQVYYRDPDTNFCPSPSGATYNISSALSVVWSG